MPRQPLNRRSVHTKECRDNTHDQKWQDLVVELLPLVKRVAFKIRQHLPSHVEMDDLVADGVLGLLDALAKFDSNKRVKLESYARHRIRGAILDGLRRADPATRDLRRMKNNVQQLYCGLESRLGRPVRDEEMAGALGMSLARWHDTLNRIEGVGLDCGGRRLTAGPTSRSVGQQAEPGLLQDNAADAFDLCVRSEQREIVGRALPRLRERERRIIGLYYHHELTMKQIADHLGVDESRVSQLHSAALAQLGTGVVSLLKPRLAISALAR
jgi:RNA polymerase sigma factor for flagellar operon FliA